MLSQMGPLDWTLAATMSFLGGLITGAGGFGFALVTTPVMVLVFQPSVVVVTNLAISVGLRVPLLWADRKHVVFRHAIPIVLAGALGMPLGVLVVRTIDTRELTLVAEILIIVLSAAQLVGADRLPRLVDRFGIGRSLVGVTSGVLNTSVSLSGPPMVLWLLNQRIPSRNFRATVSMVGLILNAGGVMLLMSAGDANVSWLIVPLALYPCAVAGTLAGHVVVSRLDYGTFSRAATVFVIGSAVIGLLIAV